ncbi:hypothetical protein [Dactylosporangium sp. CA-092794]|uniref:hypothetical protein n=1 Tax=Dactylosporangium sp. CA-092794 TaxID=3239929 RepID=UPI003D8AE917
MSEPQFDEGTLRVLMRADDDPPESRVDLALVLADGRRRRRARQGVTMAVTAAVTVLGLTGAAAATLQPPAPAPGPPPTAAAAPSESPSTAAAGPAGSAAARRSAGGFEPILMLRFAPGWLPAGVHPTGEPSLWAAMQSASFTDETTKADKATEADGADEATEADGADKATEADGTGEADRADGAGGTGTADRADRAGSADGAGNATEFAITLYAPGFRPRWLDPATAGGEPPHTRSPAPPLGEAGADWYTVEAGSNGLLWQWAPGAYATVEGTAPGTLEQNRALWRRVAGQLRTDVRAPEPIGVRLTSVAAPLVLIGVDRSIDPATGATTTLTLAHRAYVPPADRSGPGYRVTVSDDSVHLDASAAAGPPPSAEPIPDRADWTTDPMP